MAAQIDGGLEKLNCKWTSLPVLQDRELSSLSFSEWIHSSEKVESAHDTRCGEWHVRSR
jgi:hypothetical protein